MPLTNEEKSLFALAQEYVANGRLPRTAPRFIWAGRGTGATCKLCALTIEPRHVEYELTGSDGVMVCFHMRCHAIWQLAASDSTKGLMP